MRPHRLPAGLDDARDLALEREPAEAETADAELAQKRAGTAAELAAVVLAGLELRLLGVFDALCGVAIFRFLSGYKLGVAYAPWRNGMPKALSKARAPLSSAAVVTIVTFMPLVLSTLA